MLNLKISIKKAFVAYFQNLSNNQKIIPSYLKKNFEAKISVMYPFGKCKYSGTVKQHGDANLDHISFNDSKPLRSLAVSLKSGNIMNAVKFKLLLP